MHGVHTDILARVLYRRRLSEYANRALGGVVSGVTPAAGNARARRDVDDGATARLSHLRYDALSSEECALGVDVHNLVPHLFGCFKQPLRAENGSVIDENVNLAEALYCRFDGAPPARFVGYIEPDEKGPHRLTRRFPRRPSFPSSSSRSPITDPCALAREYASLCRAHTARAATYNRNLAFQSHSFSLLYIRVTRQTVSPPPLHRQRGVTG